jgi:2-keto-4-pentenoate hydratase/2-oxohepta-3-ene-1,7-dioic acid hydratase in catechol pathway
MKIICVGRNYAAHAAELNNEVPSEPVIFMKPDTAMLKDNKPFFIPEFSSNIHYEAELVFKIGRQGKHIDAKFADKYITEITVGIDFTARDVQDELKKKGLPWERAKAFDNSAALGKFKPTDSLKDGENIRFRLERNGQTVQNGESSLMIFKLPQLISYVSRYFVLKTGDLLFTGTPEGVGKVETGDVLTGFLEEEEVFSFKVK